MNVTLKTNMSPNNTVNKTFASSTQTFDCYLLDSTSAISPTIVVLTDLATASKYNYMDVPTLGRKYFIRDIVSLDSERVQISGAVDVLSSFADAVMSANIMTSRSTKNINVFVPDNSLVNSTRGISQIKSFTGGEWMPTVLGDTNSIVVTTFGGGDYGVG